MAITQLPPLSLYIHFPWCVQKCPYCDFNSHAVKNFIPEAEYIDALLSDLDQELPSIWGRSLTSIFIGGGTPSLISVHGIDRLLSGIRARLPFLADTEVTMEANPGTVEAEKFNGFYQAGINRISIGAQSFNDQFLSVLGRIHKADEAKKAFDIARNAGFKNINIDLMFALPNQSVQQAIDDLKVAVELQPEHLSWYQLTLEPNTEFYRHPPKQMADDDQLADISEQGLAFLAEHQFERYEISAFSKHGQSECWHNTNYWQFGDYLGIGAGAHGKITRADTQQIIRTSKRRSPKNYLDSKTSFIDKIRILEPQELPLEFMMNLLRLKNGFNQDLFFQTTGLLFSQIETVVEKCVKKGWLKRELNIIQTTETGYRFLNDILAEFLDDNFAKLRTKETIKIKQVK